MNKSTFLQNGSVLLEAVVALGVIVIIMTAMAIITTVSIGNATFIKDQNLANKYAQEGIDYVRFMQESDYQSFYTAYVPSGNTVNQLCFNDIYELSGNYCSYQSYHSRDLDPVLRHGFQRVIYISNQCASNPTNANSFQVEVKVSWAGGKCSSVDRFCHKADLVSCLYANPDKQNP